MQRERRLTGAKRFSSIRHDSRVWSNRLLVLKMIPNGLETSRFGLVVGKRLGGAVVRNKVKRRLREVIRPKAVESGWDVVLIARRWAPTADFHQLKRATEELLTRARLLSDPAVASSSAIMDIGRFQGWIVDRQNLPKEESATPLSEFEGPGK